MPEYTQGIFLDQFSASLQAQLTDVATVANIEAAKAALMTDAATGRGYTVTLDDGAGNIEVCQVFSANGTTGDISLTRGRWGTTPQTFAAGTKVEIRLTSGQLNHHILRNPSAVKEVTEATFDDLKWPEWTMTHLVLTANVPTIGLDAPGTVNAALAGCYIHDILVQQDGTGGRTAGWDSSIKWPGGVAPTISAGANKLDIFRLFRVVPAMSFWYGTIIGQDIG